MSGRVYTEAEREEDYQAAIDRVRADVAHLDERSHRASQTLDALVELHRRLREVVPVDAPTPRTQALEAALGELLNAATPPVHTAMLAEAVTNARRVYNGKAPR